MWWVTRQGRIPCLVGDAQLRMGEGKGQGTRHSPVCRAVYAASQLIFHNPSLLGTSKKSLCLLIKRYPEGCRLARELQQVTKGMEKVASAPSSEYSSSEDHLYRALLGGW